MEITERVILDVDRCVQCKACFAACYYSHRQEPIVNYGNTGEIEFPLICRQCDEPTCVDSCPYEAMYKDEHGIVKRSLQLCRGCGSCVVACPFGTVTPLMFKHQVPKCDCCEEFILDGELPRCVASCSAGALQFIEISESDLEANGFYAISGRTLGHHLFKRR